MAKDGLGQAELITKISRVKISNFKAISSVELDISRTFNVIVGENGSGKSSILQSLHWMFQSGRNPDVEPSQKASTLSEAKAIYMPSPEYRNAGHGTEYGNNHRSPQLGIDVWAEGEDGAEATASMWLKSARNEGLSVHVPTNNEIVATLRDRNREFSAYIPGVAGIALSEAKLSKLVVHRSAAAGDANTVLRNILLLLKGKSIDGQSGLDLVAKLVSEVIGEFRLEVSFDEERDTSIVARFQTGAMRESDSRAFRPLELAGTGYLQVLQIFSYLVYFRPIVLLVDEPDAHLYPIAQERLVRTLGRAASEFGSQVILTTHSPSVVRSLPSDSQVIWMRAGEVVPGGDSIGRTKMGWGLLDKRILLMTEDCDTSMLESILAQWPELERLTAVWSFRGTGNLPSAEGISGLASLFGGEFSVVLHRDRDFLMPVEAAHFAEKYERVGMRVWFTEHSDIEAYWLSESVISTHFGIDLSEAHEVVSDAVSQANASPKCLEMVRRKRNDLVAKINRDGALPQFGDQEIQEESCSDGPQYGYMGKSMLSFVRAAAKARGCRGEGSLARVVPAPISGSLAPDLKTILEECLG